MTRSDKQEKFFYFLQKNERESTSFTVQDIVNDTGWGKSTFTTYFSKGYFLNFVNKESTDHYIASNTISITYKEFHKKVSQSKKQQSLGHNCKSLLAIALLGKCQDNMMLALELYNRPSLNNKIDGFVMLFCCAWEQLLKAIIIEQLGENTIYESSRKSGIKKTISLRSCLKLIFENDKNKVRKNIEQITEFRDKAVHLLMPELQGVTSRIFQSGILNFSAKFEEFTEVPFIDSSHSGMISLVGDFKVPPISVLKSMYGDAATDISSLASNLTKTIEDSDDIEFAIPLNVKLVFAKDDSQGTQVVLTKAEDGMSGLQEALILEKTVSIEISHPYLQNNAIQEINKKLNENFDEDKLKKCLPAKNKIGKPILNSNCFQALVFKLKWQAGNNEFHHYMMSTTTHFYSDAAVETIIKNITEKEDYLKEAKTSKNRRDRKKTSKSRGADTSQLNSTSSLPPEK